jgi:hypothetical protein
LRDTLRFIDLKIEESLPFAHSWTRRAAQIKGIKTFTPEQLFYTLKEVTHYRNDPPGIELLQSMPSLFLDNYYNRPGTGDCDCFTITACACLLALGYNTGYTLYGNGAQPTHIAADVYLKESEAIKRRRFDLVAPHYNLIKPYLWEQNYKLYL